MDAVVHLAAALARSCLRERCPSCAGATEAGFCPGCRADLPAIARPCSACGLPRPVRRCPRKAAAWHVARVISPFEYGPPIDGFLQALKFGHGRTLGRALGLLLTAEIEARACDNTGAPGSGFGADVLVPVPLHRRRLVARGYNQATEIARTLSASLCLPLEPAAAVRVRAAAAPQSRLTARERRANVEDAFEVRSVFLGRRVAIVDDVITTGATVNALAAALLLAGADRVEAWAVARTVPPGAIAQGRGASPCSP